MRTAEIVTACALMALSVFFMAYAVALPIGWDARSGPGGGAFPFWLSAGMFVTGGVILVQQLRAGGGPRIRDAVFIDRQVVAQLSVIAGSLVATVALIHWLGAYVAIVLFLLFYLKIIGRQSWTVILPITLATPVALFFFFEVTLKILLPKGLTEPLFFPLYAMFF